MGKEWPVSVKGVIPDHQGRILLAMNPRREWELPGGRLEENETPHRCLCREVMEECGLEVTPLRPLECRVFEVIPGKFVLLVPYLCAPVGPVTLQVSEEHTHLAFCIPDTGLLLPADYAAIIGEALSFMTPR